MSRRIMIAVLCLGTAANIIALAVNFSLPSRAATQRMDYQALMKDPDFTRAVKSIAEACNVNLDIGKLKC
jgi:hypothetical protein